MSSGEDLILRVAVAVLILPTIAVCIRFWSKGIAQKGRYSIDDWLALVAWVLCLGSPAINLSNYGASTERILKSTFANDLLFHLSVGISKLSALAFYHKVFNNSGEGFLKALKVVAFFDVAYMLYAIPSIIFSCTPVDKFWHTSKPGHCIDYYTQSLVVATWDTVLDLIILILPMPRVFRLTLEPSRKLLTAAAFLCGYCALVVSIGHLVASARYIDPGSDNFSTNGIELAIWSELEVPVTVFSICLPSCFWLFKRARSHGFRALFTSRQYSARQPGYRDNFAQYRLHSGDTEDLVFLSSQRSRESEDLRRAVAQASGSPALSLCETGEMELGKIRVRHDIDVDIALRRFEQQRIVRLEKRDFE